MVARARRGKAVGPEAQAFATAASEAMAQEEAVAVAARAVTPYLSRSWAPSRRSQTRLSRRARRAALVLAGMRAVA